MVVSKYAKYRQPAAPSPEEEPQEPARANKYAKFRATTPEATADVEQPSAPRPAPFVPERDNAPNMAAMIRKDYQGAIPEQPRYFKRPSPVMLPEELAELDAENAREAQRAKERKEAAGALGGGMDLMPTMDAGGNVRPGTDVDTDLSKGIGTAPIQFGQGLGEGAANVANVGFAASTGLFNAGMNLIDPDREQTQPWQLEFPENEFLENEGSSVSGMAPRIAGQVMSARVPMGKAMPGGGFGAEVAKDALAFGLSTPQDTPRLSDMVASETPIIGGVADFLKTNPNDNAFTAFGKNAAEDLLIGGGVGATLRGGIKAVDAIGSRAPRPPVAMARAPAIAPPPPVRPIGPPVAPDSAGPLAFSASPEPTRLNSVTNNPFTRNADRIAGGAIGASMGGVGDAYAAPGDGSDGGPPVGAGLGATIGIFGPRALATAGSRGYRAAARAARPVAVRGAFDERLAAKAVRDALKSGGINSSADATTAYTSRFGDKPAAIADLTQEGVGTAAGISRLPGATGEAARARGEDLLQNRAGRLERDIADATGASPATISGDVERMVQLAREQATPAYSALREQYPFGTFASPRLDALRELEILRPHIRGVERYRDTLAATEGRTVGDFEFWDLVKRSLDDAEQSASARNQPVPYDLDSARQAIVREVDQLVPDYAAARQLGGEAPRMQEAFRNGQSLLGGRYTTEDVTRVVEGVTGQQLTAMQAGVIRSMVGKAEGSRNTIAALTSTGAHRKLSEVFGAEAADAMRARFLSDAAIVNNAHRINPNVGSVTSQAQMSGGLGPLLADGIRAIRNPAEAALAALSRSGSYSKAQRDRMGEMLLGGATPENLARIFPPSRTRGRRGPTMPPTAPTGATAGGPPGWQSMPTAPSMGATPPRPPVKNGSGPINKAGFGSSSLDMSEAGRMQRAREQGFDVETPYYHGTYNARDIEEFDLGNAGAQSGSGEAAIFLSDSPKRANRYAEPAMRDLQEPSPEQWAKAKQVRGLSDEQMREYDRRTAPTPGVFKTFVRGPVRDVDWVEYTGSHKFDSDAMERLIAEQRANGGGNIRIRNMADGGNDPSATTMVVLDPKNIRSTTAAFDPSQSGSSKLLAGMGGPVASQVGPPAFAATVASVGPEGEAPEDKWARMAAAAALTVGVRNLPALRKFASESRGTNQATFGGINAKTADLKLKGIAEQMEKAGAGRDQIWKETGWFKGNDGKWRFEIDDSASRLGDRSLEDFVDKGSAKGKAAGVLWNRPVYDAYPDMRNVDVTALNASTISGNWDKSGPRIYAQGPTSDEARSVILHEGQHGVQDAEDFARGGNPREFESLDYVKSDEIREVVDEAERLRASIKDPVLKRLADDYYWTTDAARKKDLEGVLDLYGPGRRLVELEKARVGLVYSPARSFDTYRNLAGEVEARNVQTRRDFTPEERRARPPWTTQDVPDDQQIVRYGAGQANSEPTPPRSITLATVKGDKGGTTVIKGEAYNDRGRMVLSPEWPSNAFDEMHAARLKRAEELLYPDLHRPKPTLVDENYGKPKPPRPEWEVENPKAAAEIGRKVAERFVGLMNADPSPVHVLALKEGVDIQSIGEIVERGLPKNRQIWIAKDGGEIAVVDKAWHRQNPQEYTTERWNRMWPSSVTREGRRYGWQEGRPFIFADDTPKPPPAQAGFSFGGKGPSKPPASPAEVPPKGPPARKPGPPQSKAEQEARAALKKARTAHTNARRQNVMRDNRDELNRPLELAEIEAGERLQRVLDNDARLKTMTARGREIIESPNMAVPLKYGVGGAAVGGSAILGYNALMPKDKGERPMSPSDKRFYWTSISKRKDAMVPIQLALREWGEWPEDTDATGMYGATTKAALRAWRYDRGLPVDDPMTKQDVARLLAGPKGYQDRDGKTWRYGSDGERVSPP